MFKENFFIYRESPGQKPHSGELVRPKLTKSELTDVMAGELTHDDSIEQKASDISMKLFEMFNKSQPKIFKSPKPSPNLIAEIFFNKKLSNHILGRLKGGHQFMGYDKGGMILQLRGGYQFVGYDKGGMILQWFDKSKGETISEINPSFLEPKVRALLNRDANEIIVQHEQKLALEKSEKQLATDIEAIFKSLKNDKNTAKFISKTMTAEQFAKSDLAEELRELLSTGINRGHPYKFRITADGFTLENNHSELVTPPFQLETYDLNLNHLRESAERKTESYIEKIVIPQLKKFRPARPGNPEFNMPAIPALSADKIRISWLVDKEIRPIILDGYQRGVSYRFKPEAEGFTLEPNSLFLAPQPFDLAHYDMEFNLPQGKGVADVVGEDNPKKNNPHDEFEEYIRDLGKIDEIIARDFATEKRALESMTEETPLPEIFNQMDSIARKNPKLRRMNEKIKPLARQILGELNSGKFGSRKEFFNYMERLKEKRDFVDYESEEHNLRNSSEIKDKAAMKINGEFREVIGAIFEKALRDNFGEEPEDHGYSHGGHHSDNHPHEMNKENGHGE